MPTVARAVVAGVAHHVTQRGNNRRQVFFDDEDCRTRLKMLGSKRVDMGCRS